jgi:hypothetical protein
MLHWIMRTDPQPDLHDHPNAFVSVVLRGWYAEETPKPGSEQERIRKHIVFLNIKRARERHRIVALGGKTLTLVFAGPVVRGWGFHTPHGWKPWREYVARRQANSVQKTH